MVSNLRMCVCDDTLQHTATNCNTDTLQYSQMLQGGEDP